MKRYYEPVGFSSRSKMTDFLKHHFRYFTMNFWNCSESYAYNLKIYRLWLKRESENKVYVLIQRQEFFDALKNSCRTLRQHTSLQLGKILVATGV